MNHPLRIRNTRRAKAGVIAGIAGALSLMGVASGNAHASLLFSENFNASTFNSGLQANGGSVAWTSGVAGTGALTGQNVIQHQAGSGVSRNYIRTTDSDYNTIDFRMQLTLTTGGSDPNSLIFIGLGDGAPGTFGPGEPNTGIYFRAHNPSNAGADGILGINNGAWAGSYNNDGYGLGSGTHRLQLEKVGNLLTFSVDKNFSGVFSVDHTWASYDLSLPIYNFLNTGNSRLFFGTGTAYPQFDNLTITDLSGGFGGPVNVSEPPVWALMFLGLGLMARRQKRSAAKSG
ncbi:MAG: hypothetical protein HZB71_14645 [Betaproteobacteria bacterium]|nr:hypothetical protein [Betaproteobacteria bacterium]